MSPEDKNFELETTQFYQIKKKTYGEDETESHVIQLIDISTSVRFRKLVGEHRLLEVINALVSHEMRNPLNAISAMIGRIKEQYHVLVKNIKEGNKCEMSKSDKVSLACAENIMFSSCILDSAAKLLNFTVADMLSLAQINSNKFKKNCTVMNIKDVV